MENFVYLDNSTELGAGGAGTLWPRLPLVPAAVNFCASRQVARRPCSSELGLDALGGLFQPRQLCDKRERRCPLAAGGCRGCCRAGAPGRPGAAPRLLSGAAVRDVPLLGGRRGPGGAAGTIPGPVALPLPGCGRSIPAGGHHPAASPAPGSGQHQAVIPSSPPSPPPSLPFPSPPLLSPPALPSPPSPPSLPAAAQPGPCAPAASCRGPALPEPRRAGGRSCAEPPGWEPGCSPWPCGCWR